MTLKRAYSNIFAMNRMQNNYKIKNVNIINGKPFDFHIINLKNIINNNIPKM